MIPAIGYMIGMYIIARATEMMGLHKNVVWCFALLSAVVAALMMAGLFMTDARVPANLLQR